MTAPLTPSRLRALAEQCRDTGVVIEVRPDGTLRLFPPKSDTIDEYEIREIKP